MPDPRRAIDRLQRFNARIALVQARRQEDLRNDGLGGMGSVGRKQKQ